MSDNNKKAEYASVKIPTTLIDVVSQYIGHKGFTSIAEITKQALREYMERNPLPTGNTTNRFERINADPTGIKIFDRKLTGERLVHVTISPHGILCDFHASSTCEHVEYTLQQPDVQEIIREKKKEGWKLP